MFFVYSASVCSDLMTITLGAVLEHVPWRPILAWFAPTRGVDLELVSTGRPLVFEVILLQSGTAGTEVTVAVPPPSGVREEKRLRPPSPRVEEHTVRLHVPSWRRTKGLRRRLRTWSLRPRARGLRVRRTSASPNQAVSQSSSPLAQQAMLEEGQERAMVPISSPSGSTSGSVGEWAWPDPSKPGEA
jgi:hypothetical protein